MAKNRKPRVAIAYDFDGTLAPGNMQEHQFIPDIGMKISEFWSEVGEIAKENEGDQILVYMSLMLEKARAAKVSVRKEDLSAAGAGIELFAGLDDWFDRIDAHAKDRGVLAEHYMISSGNDELVRGTHIASRFKKIYASRYRYDHHGVAEWPVLAVNYTNKTQFLFRINKGTLDAHDHKGVNKFVPSDERPIPFSNMIFIGDGETDVPCFRLVKDQGGTSIAVYQPHSRKRKKLADQLFSEGRVHCAVPADYSAGKDVEATVCAKIDEIAAQHALKKRFG
ncbi:haloacid dehalogenase-like hydrolase [Rhodobacteraceae bacterium NNCM2]|nr:haloacid dehalogenase-like hydrolase [Coraliihabitans acroporae]